MSDLITIHVHYSSNKFEDLLVNKHHSIKHALMNHVNLEDKYTLFKGSLLNSSFTFSKYGINNGDDIAILDSNNNDTSGNVGFSNCCNQIPRTNSFLSSMWCRKDANRFRCDPAGVTGNISEKRFIGVTNDNFPFIYEILFGHGKNKPCNDELNTRTESKDRLSDGEELPSFWRAKSGDMR